MALDRKKLEEIYEFSKATGDDDHAELAGALLMAEDEWTRLRHVLVTLAGQTMALLNIVEMSFDPRSFMGERAADLKRFITGVTTEDAGEPMLKELHYAEGVFTMTTTHWSAAVIAHSLAASLAKGGDEHWNFIEMSVDHKDLGPLTVTVQRTRGKTPADLLREANARVAELEGQQ